MTRVSVVSAFLSVPNSSDATEWRFHPDAESEITTLAAWRQIRQLQREPLSSTKDGEDDLDESIDDEECTNLLAPASLDGDSGIKKGFLDRLAELLCCRKEPSLITSTALLYNDEEVTIVAARNSPTNGKTWSDEDIMMLECLAVLLERISSDDIFESDPLPALRSTLVGYYSQRIRHHAKEAMSIEGGKTGLNFFKGDEGCRGVASGQQAVSQFANCVEHLSHNTDFYAELEANLTPKKLRRVVEELAFIRRPMQGADAFVHVAQQCSGFRNIKITLLDSLPPRKVEQWHLSGEEFPAATRLEPKFGNLISKLKHVHAEMMLMAYLSSRIPRTDVFPYLGISKKICLLCGHMLREMGQFETRGNHGKCYSQWTLPSVLWINSEDAKKLCKSVQYIRDSLRSMDEASHRDAEKESMIAAAVPPAYARTQTIFNSVVEDPRFLAREAEWFTMSHKRNIEAKGEISIVNSEATWDITDMPRVIAGGPKSEDATPTACAFCKNSLELAHSFLACHTNQFPQEDNVIKQYGFLCFTSGYCRWRLFELYRRLVTKWKVDEEELRSAVELNRLKEMLTARCSQTGDPAMLSDMKWLESEEVFRANGEGPEITALFNAAQKQFLNPQDRKLPLVELQPLEKRQALIFYAQICNGFMPDVDEDHWISLGFCTAADPDSEQRLASAYRLLVGRCSFDEFWNAMSESRIVELFGKYGLADRISNMRNFKILMAIVLRRHQSVWELKRFTRMNVADPFRAVIVDYGFMNCEDARHRMQLRGMYREYFERGEDEMRLHEACIAGELANFLESIFGSLGVPPHLLSNPYPLENCPLIGMVTKYVIMCPESALDQVRALKGSSTEGAEIFTIPDADDAAMIRFIHEKAAFLGTGLRKRYYSGSDGKVIMELA
ncbi:hypothetical protein TASIC1_0017010500 [Trichoderma asperellum]|uniref:Uncharacterized protein n=1 Tax=Trichoderma asperellum TaxID=101201 RepID=A0A6V8RCJ2_TRIAP|nr:hypothetical protein TASIC1_0017010500 [Trichoderma asperellum]